MLQTFLNWAVSFAIRWLTSSVKRTTNFCHNPKNFGFLFWLISLQQRKTPKKEENIIKVAMEKKQEHFLNFWLSFFFWLGKKISNNSIWLFLKNEIIAIHSFHGEFCLLCSLTIAILILREYQPGLSGQIHCTKCPILSWKKFSSMELISEWWSAFFPTNNFLIFPW